MRSTHPLSAPDARARVGLPATVETAFRPRVTWVSSHSPCACSSDHAMDAIHKTVVRFPGGPLRGAAKGARVRVAGGLIDSS